MPTPENREMREVRATAAISKQVARAERLKSKRILYVEDGLLMRELLEHYLTGVGFSVFTAGSLKEARKTYMHVDLIMLDCQLPDGNGLELARDLRASGSKIPIIVMTASLTHTDEADAFIDAWFEKPADLDTLVATIEHLLLK